MMTESASCACSSEGRIIQGWSPLAEDLLADARSVALAVSQPAQVELSDDTIHAPFGSRPDRAKAAAEDTAVYVRDGRVGGRYVP